MLDAAATGGITLSIGVLIIIFSAVRNLTERDRLELLSRTNQELQDLQGTLEQRVKERTAQLQASAEVGQAAAATLEPNLLLRHVVEPLPTVWLLLCGSIYLPMGTAAVLREASGEARPHLEGS
jgi:C4-dicarboxylate-specific signal transduction histidine kinase